MGKLIMKIFGYTEFTFIGDRRAALLSLFLSKGLHISSYEYDGENTVIALSVSDAANAEKIIKGSGERIVKRETKGFVPYIARYRKRYGIYAGCALYAALLFILMTRIWEIKITGIETMTDHEARGYLESVGIYEGGSNIFDVDSVRNRLVLSSDKIAWASVYADGVIAKIDIKESVIKEKPKKDEGCANVVAEKGGVIVSTLAYGGRAAVIPGQVVKEGDVLISGIYEDKYKNTHYAYAKGKVMARTDIVITSECEALSREKIYTGEEDREFRIIFSKKSLKIGGKCRFTEGECDTIRENSRIVLFSLIKLPISLETTTYKQYKIEDVERNREEMQKAAMKELSYKKAEIAKSADILLSREKVDISEGVCKVTCTLTVIEEIGKTERITKKE